MAAITLQYIVDGKDFVSCGRASEQVKQNLKMLAFPAEAVRRIVIAMYEGEVNMVIHANGGVADVEITETLVRVRLTDTGKGIPDIEQAMKAGFSTAGEEIRELGFGAGMGLPNMAKYSDSMVINSTVGVGTEVIMEFKLD
ncbi:MAG: ATP-binding protein [Clostridiales bacterium]|jgi:anti-sigma regulatory factor (Ser/Thr protein kinase)|nr:ATP-binding protein [Clostridiales bacterium]